MKNTEGFDASLIHRSVNCNIFDYLGAHRKNNKIIFRVWAPHADEVYLVGDFNSWSESHPMKKITAKGIWECAADYHAIKGTPLYKYMIKTGDRILYKADPFGRQMQAPPNTATVWYDADAPFDWTDNSWMQDKRKSISANPSAQPINVYEVHLGSFMRHTDGSYMNYREIAPILASYLKKMSCTHVELLPVAEHPHDSSLGYDISGFYSPTSRFGSPDDLKYLINTLHNCGIGVIFDFVPSHFPCDEHGLYQFDGSNLYESYVSSSDGSKRYFDIAKTEVQSFLISNACFYARELHADGLRVTGLRRMLYLDYEKKKGEWTPNRHGGNVNFESVAFIRQLNRTVKHLYPDVLMIADECGSFKNTTGTDEGGLGFDLAWDPTPLKAALSIVKSSMTSRKYSELNDTISYHRECLMLPLSHISLSLASRSLIDNTAGAYELRFAQLKSFFTYAMTLPSKKLSFMSNEFGQFAPWDHAKSIEWFMLNYDTHRRLRDFTADLGALYLTRNELWEADASSEGCALISASSQEHRWASYKRINKAGDELLVILSLAEDVKHITGLPIANGTYRILSSSEYVKYGGNRSDDIKAVTIQDGSLHLDIFPFESLILERVTN